MRKERDGTYHGDRSNFLSLRVRGKEKSIKREEKKTKKNLIYENEWKKAKTTPKSELMESTWKKKKGEQTKGELNSLTFQTHLSFTLYTHTHTTKKHFKSCPNLCKLLAECVFLFVFFSLRIVTLTGTRRANFVLGKNGYNYCCVCRRWLHQNRSIQKKEKS